jgi:hypothetical protein
LKGRRRFPKNARRNGWAGKFFIVPGLVPGIHVFLSSRPEDVMAGISARSKASSPRPAMTMQAAATHRR